MADERPVYVVGAGAISAVGLSPREIAASCGAGIARLAEIEIHDRFLSPFVMGTVPEEALPDLLPAVAAKVGPTPRELRMVRLAAVVLDQIAEEFPSAARPSLHLALPELETLKPLDRSGFLALLELQVPSRFRAGGPSESRGRAGGLTSIGKVVEMIRADRAPYALAGGVDTYREQAVLAILDAQGRIKSERNSDGLIPGEGAAVLLLCSESALTAHRWKPLATISAVALGREPGHLGSEETYRGDGLAEAVGTLFREQPPGEPVKAVYSTMNGESHWGKEWATAFARASGEFDPEHSFLHPAECYGDLGSAAGPMMVVLAALGISGGTLRSPVLVYASSDTEERAALLVRSAEGT